MPVGVGVNVLLVCDFDCWKSLIKLLCRNLLSVRRIIGPVHYQSETIALSVSQHEIANLRDITGYVKFRKVELTALRRVNKDT